MKIWLLTIFVADARLREIGWVKCFVLPLLIQSHVGLVLVLIVSIRINVVCNIGGNIAQSHPAWVTNICAIYIWDKYLLFLLDLKRA